MRTTYMSWLGRPVVLQVALGDRRIPVRGIVVGESDEAVRLRIGESWDVDIFKGMIDAVEAEGKAQRPN
jgi:hypothetical protein